MRSISIATGQSYRLTYEELGELSGSSVRDGVYLEFVDQYLRDLGWRGTPGDSAKFHDFNFPTNPAIFSLSAGTKRKHLCAVIGRTVYDTWDPREDEEYTVDQFWTAPQDPKGHRDEAGIRLRSESRTHKSETQQEFEKILNRLRALDRTAHNEASTDGEKRNAIRMIQNLMLEHNLRREDLKEDETQEPNGFMRRACPLNGRRAAQWEKQLAFYVTQEIFPMVQWYTGTKAHRTLFWFYGPVNDVSNALTVFRELVATIASAAQLKYGGYARGSGASYAEGYVAGLPRQADTPHTATDTQPSSMGLIPRKVLSVHRSAKHWLRDECHINLVSGSTNGRSQHDSAAATAGRRDGASHEVRRPGQPNRITQR